MYGENQSPRSRLQIGQTFATTEIEPNSRSTSSTRHDRKTTLVANAHTLHIFLCADVFLKKNPEKKKSPRKSHASCLELAYPARTPKRRLFPESHRHSGCGGHCPRMSWCGSFLHAVSNAESTETQRENAFRRTHGLRRMWTVPERKVFKRKMSRYETLHTEPGTFHIHGPSGLSTSATTSMPQSASARKDESPVAVSQPG